MRSLFLLIFVILCLTADATIYYISASGNDFSSGTSISKPWKTISKLNSFDSLVSGDVILFNRGETFYGSIMVRNSGSSGNPIIFSAYGAGSNPIITGFTNVIAWRNLGGNIWESASPVSTLSTCNMVVINGVNTPMGRYPNAGYLPYQSHTGSSSITSSNLRGKPNWTGAEVVMRPTRWMLQKEVITSQSGSTLAYSGSTEKPTDGYGFFIQNDSRTLDTTNEWYYNTLTKKIRIYNASTPTNVQVSTIDELVFVSGLNYITFDHIDFEGANSYLFENRNGKYITLENCSFLFAGKTAIYINGKVSSNESMTIDSNVFNDNNENAMSFASYTSNIWIKNNKINNTGMIPGAGTSSQNSCDAIDVYGKNNIVEYNTINNSGHNAIAMRHGDGMIVRYNYITNFGMTRYDAGGIYSWNQDSTITTSRIVDHNIILYSKKVTEGIGAASPSLFGIYLDGDSKNTFITNNTIAHCKNGNGIFILNSGSCTITNNVCYDNGSQLAFVHAYGGGMNIANMTVKSNIFFSKTIKQLTFYYRDDNGSFNFGVADSNYYARPIDDNLAITTQVVYIPTDRTLAGWQTFSGQDSHSKKSPKTIIDTSDLRFEYNATFSVKEIRLDALYMDVAGTVYRGSVTLAPYTSVILCKV